MAKLQKNEINNLYIKDDSQLILQKLLKKEQKQKNNYYPQQTIEINRNINNKGLSTKHPFYTVRRNYFINSTINNSNQIKPKNKISNKSFIKFNTLNKFSLSKIKQINKRFKNLKNTKSSSNLIYNCERSNHTFYISGQDKINIDKNKIKTNLEKHNNFTQNILKKINKKMHQLSMGNLFYIPRRSQADKKIGDIYSSYKNIKKDINDYRLNSITYRNTNIINSKKNIDFYGSDYINASKTFNTIDKDSHIFYRNREKRLQTDDIDNFNPKIVSKNIRILNRHLKKNLELNKNKRILSLNNSFVTSNFFFNPLKYNFKKNEISTYNNKTPKSNNSFIYNFGRNSNLKSNTDNHAIKITNESKNDNVNNTRLISRKNNKVYLLNKNDEKIEKENFQNKINLDKYTKIKDNNSNRNEINTLLNHKNNKIMYRIIKKEIKEKNEDIQNEKKEEIKNNINNRISSYYNLEIQNVENQYISSNTKNINENNVKDKEITKENDENNEKNIEENICIKEDIDISEEKINNQINSENKEDKNNKENEDKDIDKDIDKENSNDEKKEIELEKEKEKEKENEDEIEKEIKNDDNIINNEKDNIEENEKVKEKEDEIEESNIIKDEKENNIENNENINNNNEIIKYDEINSNENDEKNNIENDELKKTSEFKTKEIENIEEKETKEVEEIEKKEKEEKDDIKLIDKENDNNEKEEKEDIEDIEDIKIQNNEKEKEEEQKKIKQKQKLKKFIKNKLKQNKINISKKLKLENPEVNIEKTIETLPAEKLNNLPRKKIIKNNLINTRNDNNQIVNKIKIKGETKKKLKLLTINSSLEYDDNNYKFPGDDNRLTFENNNKINTIDNQIDNHNYLERKNIKNIKKDNFITLHSCGNNNINEKNNENYIIKDIFEEEFKPYVSKYPDKYFKKRGTKHKLKENAKKEVKNITLSQNVKKLNKKIKNNIDINKNKRNDFKKELSSYFGNSNNNVYFEIKQFSDKNKKTNCNTNINENKPNKKYTITTGNFSKRGNFSVFGVQSETLYIPNES